MKVNPGEPGESYGDLETRKFKYIWIPAFAGMTAKNQIIF
jgi:hypothetical protein